MRRTPQRAPVLTQVFDRELPSRMNDGNDLQLVGTHAVDDSVRRFDHLPQRALAELRYDPPGEGVCWKALDRLHQPLDYKTSIAPRIPRNVSANLLHVLQSRT
jgi:hypothetical protein